MKFMKMGAVDIVMISEGMEDDELIEEAGNYGTSVEIISKDTREYLGFVIWNLKNPSNYGSNLPIRNDLHLKAYVCKILRTGFFIDHRR